MSGRKAAASPSGELKSPFDSADSKLAICCQQEPIATAGATVPTVCQPVNPIERVALSRQDINDFIDRGAKNEKLNHTDFDLRPSWQKTNGGICNWQTTPAPKKLSFKLLTR
jgi:hypothetical protein